MSEMTLSQMREAREKAERQISDILLALNRATGLQVYEVTLHTTCLIRIGSRRSEVASIEASIKLEAP